MPRRLLASAVTVALVSAASLAVAAPAVAAGSDLYVDQASKSCQSSGPGTQAQPFCTVQAAADVVSPGQTVHVSAGQYGPVNITRSGTPDAPITFVGSTKQAAVGFTPDGLFAPRALTVTGAHDVVISTFRATGTTGAIVVDNSSHITLDGNRISGTSVAAPAAPTVGVDLINGSGAVTLSRNEIMNWGTAGVSVGAGVTGSTITTNVVRDNFAPGVLVTDAPGTVVTSNTVVSNCVSGISLAGVSTGATVENNLLHNNHLDLADQPNCGSQDTGDELSVAAGATDHTVVDYNLVHTSQAHVLYRWAGVGYSSLADFTAASGGQGTHDINADPKFGLGEVTPTEGSPAIDSADSTAPGELATDYLRKARVDDPLVPNTGNGGVADRGAFEFQDPFQLKSLDLTPNRGIAPLPVTLTANIDNPWSTPASYTFDFGDGSDPVPSSSTTVQHTYQWSDNAYPATVTAFLPSGATFHASNNVTVTKPFPALAVMQARQVGPLTVAVDTAGSTSPWQITEYDIDYGDGTVVKGPNAAGSHAYATPGTYTITLTIKDFGGGTATTSQRLTVAGAYYPVTPQRLLDTRDGGGPLGPGGQTSVQITGAHGVPAGGVTAVVLNLTATDPTANSFLSAYPSGGSNPGTSNINFAPGQTVPNLVTVPVGPDGKVVIANHTGSVDVVADLEGYYRSTPAEQTGSFLNTVQPRRIMDTRDGTGGVPAAPIGAGRSQVLNVAQYVPNAVVDAVALNVTVTNPTADSFVTVSPNNGTTPTASNLNFHAGETVSNLVIVPVTLAGEISFFNHAGSADVIADVQGYFLALPNGFTPTTAFTPLTPSRMLDTRDGTGGFSGPINPNETIAAPVAGTGSVPADAKAVVLNVTVVNGTADSYLTVSGGFRASTSNLNFGPGQIKQVLVIAPVGGDGRVEFYNHVGTVDVVADVFGYFA